MPPHVRIIYISLETKPFKTGWKINAVNGMQNIGVSECARVVICNAALSLSLDCWILPYQWCHIHVWIHFYGLKNITQMYGKKSKWRCNKKSCCHLKPILVYIENTFIFIGSLYWWVASDRVKKELINAHAHLSNMPTMTTLSLSHTLSLSVSLSFVLFDHKANANFN